MPAAKLDLKPKDIWWHKKGYYRVCVMDLIEADDRTWVQFFALENCDETYKAFKGDRFQSKDPVRGIKGNFYEKNQVCVLELQRYLSTFVPTKPDMIQEIVPMVVGAGSEELIFRPLDSILGQGTKKGSKKVAVQTLAEVEQKVVNDAKAQMAETLQLAQEHLSTIEIKALEPAPEAHEDEPKAPAPEAE